jgi:hypothetical protein
MGGDLWSLRSRRVQKGFPWAGNAAFHVGWCFNVGRSDEAPPSELVPQEEGKKRMRQFGKVGIRQGWLIAALKVDV